MTEHADPMRETRPGRLCPGDYRLDPAELARDPEIAAETLYVVGGLYGNPLALGTIEALAAAEPAPATIVLNGDAHWFDAEPGILAQLDTRLARYAAITGNVERELVRDADIGAGCGCAYPPEVQDDVVERSNAILQRLRGAIAPPVRERLRALPLTLVAHVGGLRIGIVHGDPTSIAGWGFAREHLDDPASAPWLARIAEASRIDVFASTHTCGAVMRDIAVRSGRLVVANNGAAGMGNFAGDHRGLVTRISTRASPHPALYGIDLGGVRVEALPVAFDLAAFVELFDGIWPPGSPAQLSYRTRILGETGGDPRQADPKTLVSRSFEQKAAVQISAPRTTVASGVK